MEIYNHYILFSLNSETSYETRELYGNMLGAKTKVKLTKIDLLKAESSKDFHMTLLEIFIGKGYVL